MLGFTVDTSGTVGDIKVISSPHEWLSEEALRLMQISPKWEPAIQYNKPVKGKMRQPINFRLQ
jgi:TonB family protein